MTILRSLILSLAMFTRIPMPTFDWERTNMRYVLACLPLVGILITLLLYLWQWLCTLMAANEILFAAGLLLIPILLTGGIHLDGFCDTTDALSSHASQEKKLNILKDPHAGAFAVIGLAVYLLAYFALCTQLPASLTTVGLLGAAAVLSRALGALASLTFPSAKSGGILDAFRGAAGKPAIAITATFLLAALAFMLYLSWPAALALTAAALLITLYVRLMSRRQFGGISGDVAGYLIQLIELGAVCALFILQKVLVIL